MVRMSDILRKVKERREKAEKKEIAEPSKKKRGLEQPPPQPVPDQEDKLEESSTILKEELKTEKKTEYQPKSEISISKSAMGRPQLLDREGAKELYERTIGLVKDIYDKAKAGKEIIEEDKKVAIYIEKFVNQQYLGNNNVVSLVNLSMKGDFLYYHVINVCIISIDIGIGLGYDRAKLVELGTIAIVHDIGMVKFFDLYSQPRQLNKLEYKQIQSHPAGGAEILKTFKNIYKKSITVAFQEHERLDGSGYPRGLKGDSIDEYAKIIGLADIYEAMTHLRPYRDKVHPTEVIKRIIDAKDSFEKRIVKAIILRFGCPFPLGTYVELSSGEKGKVIQRNLECPLRPVIEVISDIEGEGIEETKIIDLDKHPAIYIKGPLKEKKI